MPYAVPALLVATAKAVKGRAVQQCVADAVLAAAFLYLTQFGGAQAFFTLSFTINLIKSVVVI